jgi:hypothetical protein
MSGAEPTFPPVRSRYVILLRHELVRALARLGDNTAV